MAKGKAPKATTLKMLYQEALGRIREHPGSKKYEFMHKCLKRQLEIARELVPYIRRKRGRPKKNCVQGAATRLNKAAWMVADHLERELRDM
jgi:hypothetical protein